MSTRYSIEDLDRARDTAHMAGLEGAEVLHRLSDARILEACNGIGPEWMPAWARELLDRRFPVMQVPAMLHDLHYTLADGSDEAFHEANRMLGENGRRMARHLYGWWNPIRYLVMRDAGRLAAVCEAFGRTAYSQAVAGGREARNDERELADCPGVGAVVPDGGCAGRDCLNPCGHKA